MLPMISFVSCAGEVTVPFTVQLTCRADSISILHPGYSLPLRVFTLPHTQRSVVLDAGMFLQVRTIPVCKQHESLKRD